jgi:hypothetical protein
VLYFCPVGRQVLSRIAAERTVVDMSTPMVTRIGFRRANTASLPPTMIESVPSTAARRGAIGASAKSTPLTSNAGANSRISRGGEPISARVQNRA